MARYEQREFRLGEWFIGQRSGSPAFYRCRFNPEKRRTDRFSLGTTDFREACERLTAWYFENRRLAADSAAPEKIALAEVLLDYWNNHAKMLASAKSRKILLRYWNEFWGEATVADVRSVPRQEEFQSFLFAKGLNVGSVNRCLECGTAAINRAWKRGVISAAPFVLKVKDRRDRRDTKKGGDLSLVDLRAFYRGSEERHWHDLLHILIGTGCRPEAARELTKAQLDREAGLIHLNPPGREQTIKVRPTVRMPEAVWERFKDRPEGRLIRWRDEPMKKNERLMRAARERAGLDPSVNLYSIRHFVARWLRAHGIDGWSVACQLGHSAGGRMTVTELYASADPSYLRGAVSVLDDLLRQVTETGQIATQGVGIAA